MATLADDLTQANQIAMEPALSEVSKSFSIYADQHLRHEKPSHSLPTINLADHPLKTGGHHTDRMSANHLATCQIGSRL